MKWDWDFAAEIMPELLSGLWVTVRVTLIGYSVAAVGGLLFALLRRSRFKIIRWPTALVIEFVRSTPLLVQLFFLFFVLPDFGILLSPLQAGIIGLGLHYSAYTSEAYRAGIESVDKTQWEGAVALNMSATTTWLRVILPQAIPTVLPALGNYLISMFKDAPLLSVITVVGVLRSAQTIASHTFRFVEPLTMVGLLFLVVSIPSALFVRLLERHYGFQRA